jgi:membrane-associated phospholipid phosphatase
VNSPKLSRTEQALMLICLVFLASFLLVTFFRGIFSVIDVNVNLWIPTIQSSPFTVVAKGIAIVFDTPILVVFSFILAAFLFVKNYRAQSLLLLGAMAGDALIVSVVKSLNNVTRPLNGIMSDSGFSFPSGHSAGVIVFCGVLAYFAWQYWKNARARALTVTGVVVLTGVVGFDRLYLNVHWFSDVLGGWMFGIFWLSFSLLIFQLLQSAGKFQSERFRLIAKYLFVLAIVVAGFIVVVGLFGDYLPI